MLNSGSGTRLIVVAELLHAVSGAPYLRKFGNPSFSKILVVTVLSVDTSVCQVPFIEK